MIDTYLSIFGIIIGILSLAGIKVKFSKQLSWRQIRSACKKLLHDVNTYNPDLIIGLNDGGVCWYSFNKL